MRSSPPSNPFALPPDASISSTAALSYWGAVSPDVNGMLGGFPQISRIDLQGSSNFLAKLRKARKPADGHPPAGARLPRAVDCGAGIGRITKGLLLRVADVVDVVEPVAKFTAQITAEGEEEEDDADGIAGAGPATRGKVGDIFNVGLEDWDPSALGARYDLIWNQWCLGQLKDEQLVSYLRRCAGVLVEGGWIVVKENMTKGEDLFDDTDSSVTRTEESFKTIFRDAGLKIVATELQTGFPRTLGLYPVRSYALQPIRGG